MTSTRGNELKLREAASGPKKNNLPLNYKYVFSFIRFMAMTLD